MPLFKRRDPKERALPADLHADRHLLSDLTRIDAAHGGDPTDLSRRLTALRTAGRWNERHTIIVRAAAVAAEEPRWLSEWVGAVPDDPDASAVQAQATLAAAWSARGSRHGAATKEQLKAVDDLLQPATDELRHATKLSPGDPTAWAARIDHCRLLDQDAATMSDLAAKAADVSTPGFAWRRSAVDYLSPGGVGGSGALEESWDFAVQSAELDPHGRVVVLPAIAAILGHHAHPGDATTALLQEALPIAHHYVVEDADHDDFEQIEVANLIAALLSWAGLRGDSQEFVRVAHNRVSSSHWVEAHPGVDPRRSFAEIRSLPT